MHIHKQELQKRVHALESTQVNHTSNTRSLAEQIERFVASEWKEEKVFNTKWKIQHLDILARVNDWSRLLSIAFSQRKWSYSSAGRRILMQSKVKRLAFKCTCTFSISSFYVSHPTPKILCKGNTGRGAPRKKRKNEWYVERDWSTII